jgi:hypothetical protein
MVSFRLQPLCFWRKSPGFALNRRECGLQNRSEGFREEIHFLFLLGIEQRSL